MISILLCVRNGESYISSSIQSILDQTYVDFEVIVVVNASSDGTLGIVESYDDQRIRVFKTQIAQLTYNLNFALEQARGKYIARLDADDLMRPERLQRQLESIVELNADVVGSFMNVIDNNGADTGETMSFPSTNVEIRKKIWFRSVVAHPAVLMRKELLFDVGGYMGGRFGQDYDLWLRLMRNPNVKFYNVKEKLVDYRVHDKQSKGNSASYAEVAGYMLREFIVMRKVKYLFGSFLYLVKSFIN